MDWTPLKALRCFITMFSAWFGLCYECGISPMTHKARWAWSHDFAPTAQVSAFPLWSFQWAEMKWYCQNFIQTIVHIEIKTNKKQYEENFISITWKNITTRSNYEWYNINRISATINIFWEIGQPKNALHLVLFRSFLKSYLFWFCMPLFRTGQ